jgi:hypothetical protein
MMAYQGAFVKKKKHSGGHSITITYRKLHKLANGAIIMMLV